MGVRLLRLPAHVLGLAVKATTRPTRRARSKGKPPLLKMPDRDVRRFLGKVVHIEDGHWRWSGQSKILGDPPYRYGFFVYDHRQYSARKVAYILRYRKEPPDNLYPLCGDWECVRPDHQGVGSGKRSQRNWGVQTACVHGHPWTAESTYMTKRGSRECKICRRELDKRRYREDPERRHRIKRSNAAA